MQQNYLKEVRALYEEYPFPYRNPEDENKLLRVTLPDILDRVNHYCFGGKQAFASDFRILVAGGGTGDSTLFLAEQLRGTGAQITHLDMTSASIEVAQKRAQARGLTGITWVHDSILNIKNLGPFDYINCLGVLHHLEDPKEGLKKLTSVLKDDGAMALMVYGTFGRTGLYQMQELLSLINKGESSLVEGIANARELLPELPHTNWFIRGMRENVLKEIMMNDVNLVDALLHPQDRSYTVPEVYDFVESANLNLIAFTGFHLDDVNARELYTPGFYLKNRPRLLKKIEAFPIKAQQAIAERIVGSRSLHTFYVAKKTNAVADVADTNNIPFFFRHPASTHQIIADALLKNPKQRIHLNHHHHTSVDFVPGVYTGSIFKYLDGQRTLNEIYHLVREDLKKDVSNEEFTADFKPIFRAFELIDLLLLRGKGLPERYPLSKYPSDAFPKKV